MSKRPLATRAPLRRLALALSLSLLALAAFGGSSASAYLYWTGGFSATSVNRTTMSGTEETLEWVKGGASIPYGVAVDAGHIYWTNSFTNSIGRANLEGGEVEPEWIKGAAYPVGIAVGAGHVYWTNLLTGSIGRANLEGGEVEPKWLEGVVAEPEGVAVDAGHVYWAGRHFGVLGRANLAGGEVEPEWVKGAYEPEGVAVDAGHVYWANRHTNSIGRANLEGTEVEPEWVKGAPLPQGVAVDAGHIYWVSAFPTSIGRANLAGKEVETEFRQVAAEAWGVAVFNYPTADPGTDSLSFGAPNPVSQGTLGAPQTLTYTNNGDAALVIGGFTFAGADPGDFLTGGDTCRAAIAPGSSCTVQVRFAPQAQGTRTATLTALTNAPSDPTTALSGAAGSLPTGPAGNTGPTGPRGKAGPKAKVTCRVKGGRRPKVTCKVTYPGASKSARVAWKLTRAGHTFAHGLSRTHGGSLLLGRSKFGQLPAGRYVLHVDGRRQGTVVIGG